MPDITIVLRGPFEEADIARLVETMQSIEGPRPDETFQMMIDAPEMESDVAALEARINPLRPGYTRTVTYWENQ